MQKTSPERRSAPVRLLGGLGLVGMCSPLLWLVAAAVLWLVARDALTADLLFYAFGSTLLAMLAGAVLAVGADRLDQRRRGRSAGGPDDGAVSGPV